MPTVVAPLSTFQTLQPERQFLLMLKIVLERSYQERIDQFLNWNIDSKGVITGGFRDGRRTFNFRLSEEGLEYNPVQKTNVDSESSIIRRDSLSMVLRIDEAEYAVIQKLSPNEFRYDLKNQRKPRHCNGVSTYSCGGGCILNVKTCRIGSKAIVSPKEMQQLIQLGQQVKGRVAIAQKTQGKPTSPKKKSLDEMTLRELREEARNRGLPGYSHINKKESLLAVIKLWDSTPADQRQARKTLERKERQARKDPLKFWKKVLGLKNVLGKDPLKAGMIILGLSATAYAGMRQNYRGNYAESANTAVHVSKGIQVDKVPQNKKDITFTIDGFDDTSDSNRGQKVRDSLLKADPEFFNKHHLIASPSPEFSMLDETPPGMPGPIAGTIRNFNATRRMLGNVLVNGRNPQAIDLAANIIAYHEAYPEKDINLVGHGAGGWAAHEAAEILRSTGTYATLATNLRIVTLGTPTFGLNGEVARPNGTSKGRTVGISSAKDPFNMFPGINKQLINTVPGHELKDYVGDPRAMQLLKGTLGAYDNNNAKVGTPKAAPNVPPRDPANKADPRNADSWKQLSAEEPQKAKRLLLAWAEVERKAKEEDKKKSPLEKGAETSVAKSAAEWRKSQAKGNQGNDGSPPASPPPTPPSPNSGGSPSGSSSGGSSSGGTAPTSPPAKKRGRPPKSNKQNSSVAPSGESPPPGSTSAGGGASSSAPAPAATAKTPRENPRSLNSKRTPSAEVSGPAKVGKTEAKKKPVEQPQTEPVQSGEVDHTAETGFRFSSPKSPYAQIDLNQVARQEHGKGVALLSEVQRREVLKKTQDRLNAAIDKGYKLSWVDEGGTNHEVATADQIHPQDMIDGDVRLSKPTDKKASTATPATTASQKNPTVPKAEPAKAESKTPAKSRTKGKATPTPAAKTEPPTPKVPDPTPFPGTPEWAELERKSRAETKDSKGYSSTQKAVIASRLAHEIKHGEVVTLMPMTGKGKKVFEDLVRQQEVRRNIQQKAKRKQDDEYFLATSADDINGLKELEKSGLVTVTRKGHATLTDRGATQIDLYKVSRERPKIEIQLPGSAKISVNPNTADIDALLKGMRLSRAKLESVAQQLPGRNADRKDSISPRIRKSIDLSHRSPAYLEAFNLTAQRFQRHAGEA